MAAEIGVRRVTSLTTATRRIPPATGNSHRMSTNTAESADEEASVAAAACTHRRVRPVMTLSPSVGSPSMGRPQLRDLWRDEGGSLPADGRLHPGPGVGPQVGQRGAAADRED